MEDMKSMLAQLFFEKPIASGQLEALKARIMTEISASPVDFRLEREFAKRKVWGRFLLASFVLILFSLVFILWWNREIIIYLAVDVWRYITVLWPAFQEQQLMKTLQEQFSLIIELKRGIIKFRQAYSWQLTGITVIALLMLADWRQARVYQVGIRNSEKSGGVRMDGAGC